ncbi:amidohydrolase family protein [Mycobacterium xenopi 3993]|nr:amidohydrolase family protein [Mycobacterium xenopi 3993]
MLDDSRLATYDGVYRVNPPLRESADAAALRQALADGVIDCVATDHAPHAEHEKCVEFAAARPGMLGLQTALSVVVATMVEPGLLGWRDVARVMSENPARIAGLPDHGRPLEVGEPANLAVVDPTPPGPSPAPHWPAGRPTPLRIDDVAGDGDGDAAARQGHRSRRKVPGMNPQRCVPCWFSRTAGSSPGNRSARSAKPSARRCFPPECPATRKP